MFNNYPGWLADMINEHKCGVAVPPADPESFASALIKVADDKKVLVEMGENGRELAESKFDRNDLSDDFSKVLESLS